ncbi:MAG: glycosyltransferase [Clostridiales bacterium]|nr:glycosyltransferase [Clostridiales bacterium]MBR3248036.1 glycosyltransferase [Clostridiales bacterium]
MVFLSVIIPVYNVEGYLRRCVDSLVCQDGFEKTELLLIDDGSTDSSGSICDEYAGRYGNVITIHKSNGGLSDARNTGISKASGRYLAFIDSDDLVSDAFIRDMNAFTEKYSPDMISFGYVFERKSGEYSFRGDKSVTEKNRDQMLEDLLKLKIGNQVCFNIYKAELFGDVRFPEGRAYEDIATLYRLILKAERFITVDHIYYIYNVSNGGSITKTTTLKNMTDMHASVNEQCSALESYYSERGGVPEYLRYYRLNELIYIFIKVKREIAADAASGAFMAELEDEIGRIGKISVSDYKNYDLRKYIYYRLTHLFKGEGDRSSHGTDR